MKTNATFILYTTAAAIVSMSFSVSLTHIFIFLAFSGFLVMQIFSAYRNYSSFPLKLIKTKDLFLSERNSSLFSKFLQKLLHNNFIKTPFFPGLLLFSVLLISGLINHEQSDSFSWIYKSEFSDIALFMFGILIYSLARKNQKNRKVLTTAFEIFIVVLIISGVISLFSEFRLSKIIMQHEMIPSASNRPQHPFFNLFGAQLYQPIGFMNTRLTYAGLMIIILPYTFAKIFNETGLLRTGRKISLLIFIAGILILIFNNSRSAQAGILAAVLISIPSIVYLRPFRINRICIPGFLLFMTAGLLASGIYLHIHPEKLPSLENKITRYTDYQRPIIWKGSWELFLESPITGAGPGQFTAETYRIREIYVSLYPELLYFSNNTPAGHAHNDFLHLLSVGGIFAGVFYLAVLLITAGFLFKNKLISKTSGFIQEDFTAVFLSTGVIAVFIAGLAQCYFQDDETVAVIWTAIALISASENSGHRTLHFD